MAEAKEKGNIQEEKLSAICSRVQFPTRLLPRDQIFKVSNADKLSIQISTNNNKEVGGAKKAKVLKWNTTKG